MQCFQNKVPELKAAGSLTSDDIDYFGSRQVARNVADALGGKLLIPGKDDHTPSTAQVIAVLNGREIKIDFLNDVLGIQSRELRRGISVLGFPGTVDGKDAQIEIRLLHPVLCLKSRVISMLHPATRRSDVIARRQLEASAIVVRAYIGDALADGDRREVKECLKTLYRHLQSDPYVKRADFELKIDPLDIIKHFTDDDRIDRRYRQIQMRRMITNVERRRRSWRHRAAASAR
jgi:hypothetical protein